MIRLFGLVDGQTDWAPDRAMFLTAPFDVSFILGPYLMDAGEIQVTGLRIGEIIDGES